jgi:pyruvate carboxylase
VQVTQQAKPKADANHPGQILPGVVSTVAVELNQKLKKGDRLLVMEATAAPDPLY